MSEPIFASATPSATDASCDLRFGLPAATTVASWTQICIALADALLPAPADPFALDTVVIPSAGHLRSLSQYLASQSPEGICAGIEFLTIAELKARLLNEYLGIDRQTDPWRPRELTVAILDAIDASSGQPWFAPLAHYLRGCEGRHVAAGRRAVTARRVARLYRDYLNLAPALVEQWDQGQDVGPDQRPLTDAEVWQPKLWRIVRERIDAPDPLTRHHELCRLIRADHAPQAGRMYAGLVTSPEPLELEFLTALADGRGLRAWQLGLPGPALAAEGPNDQDRHRGSALLRRYATAKASMPAIETSAPKSTLAKLQADLRADRAPQVQYPADGSVQIHLSHGPERQVEVLREVLTGLFEDTRDLEPRDVVVLTPQLARYSAHLAACFYPTEHGQHPGQLLRAQLSGTSMPVENPMLDLARRLLALPDSRAFASDLVDLISQPSVARRFSLRSDDADELAALLADANACWGIDTKHRQSFGVDQTDGTWWQSIERMLLGIAMPADTAADLGGSVPIDSVRSDDITRVGALAEFVSRIRNQLLIFEQPTTAAGWSARLRQALTDLTAADFDSQWQLTQALGLLSDWQAGNLGQPVAPDGSQDSALLSAAEVLTLFDDWAPRTKGRPNFGNGTMLIGELGELQGVEHRVVVVLGVDDEVFPIRQARGGDDLLAGQANDRRRLASRQQFLDAILAAQERFIVIAQGADERTNARLPDPIAVQDLLDALGAHLAPAGDQLDPDSPGILRRHALQAHSWANFTSEVAGRPFSFDQEALHGAVQLSDPVKASSQQHTAWSWDYPAQPWDEELSVTQLSDFLRHPARFLLKDLHGLQLRGPVEVDRESLPLDQDALDIYAIGAAILNDLLAGASPQQAMALELGRGRVLRNKTGWTLLNAKTQDVTAIHQRLTQAQGGQLRDVDCVVDLQLREGPVRLTTRVRTWDDQVIHYTAGRANENRTLQLWLDMLMLSASSSAPQVRQGTLIAKNDLTLRSPDRPHALQILSEMVELRYRGKTRLVPLPLRTARSAVDPAYQQADDEYRKTWEGSSRSAIPGEVKDPYWAHFFRCPKDLYEIEALADDPSGDGNWGPKRFHQLARWLFGPIRAHESRFS